MTALEEPDVEKKASSPAEPTVEAVAPPSYEGQALGQSNTLKRDLQGRHMQMIAIGQCSQNHTGRATRD